jgi:uncharacterized protein (DUF433 family)
MELSNDWHKRTNVKLVDILSDILKELRPPKVPKPTHGYTIAEKAPEVVTAPGVYFPAEKGKVIPLESRQAGGPVTPTRTLQQMVEKLASYGPLVSRQFGGDVNPSLSEDPNLFKETSSVNIGAPTQEGIEAATNTSMLRSTPINVAPLQSYAPAEGSPLTPAPPVNPINNRLNQITGFLRSFMKPPVFKENRRSPIFGSDQRAAYDKKWKPYTDFMEGTKETPLFSRAPGGAVSPDPFEGLSEEELKKLYEGIKTAFPEESLASSHESANQTPALSPDNMTKISNAGETIVPKTEPVKQIEGGISGNLSEIKKDILPSGETRYTLPGTEGTATVGPERFFVQGKEVPAGTPGAASGDELARQRILKEATPDLRLPEKTYDEEVAKAQKGQAEYEAYLADRELKQAAGIVPRTGMALYEYNNARTRDNARIENVSRGRGRSHRGETPMEGSEATKIEGELAKQYFANKGALDVASLKEPKQPTPQLVQNEKGEYVHIYPPGTTGGKPTIASTGVIGKTPPQDTSEWRTHEKAGQEKGWTRDQILADWDRKQIERAGKKAEITMNMATGGTSSFPNWDEATKRQSFENFIINNQKPTFAWRDAKSRNTWELEFNKYLIEKGKTAEGVGETRFYRGAQKKALDNNEVYRFAAERFVNVIDQNIELVKKLKKNYGMNYGKLVNTAANNIIQGVPGSGDLMSLQQVLISLSNEVAKVESGSMGIAEVSVEQAKVWKKIHDYNLNESDLDKVLDTSKQLGEIRRRSLRETTDALRRELGEKEAKPGEVPKPPGTTNRPRAADFGGNPERGPTTGAKTADDLLKKYGRQ